MKSAFAFGVSVTAAALLVAIVPACSSTNTITTNPNGPQTKCDETQCLAGNKCLQGDGELKCRRPCTSNTDPASNCPAGAVCVTASAPATISQGCQKGTNDATQAKCGALTTLGGTRLTNYTCGDTPPKGCIATAEPNQWCCPDAPAETYAQPFCKRIAVDLKAGPKQWGAACNATGGREDNPDCDSAQGFACYGTSPADGASYCTRYECHADAECAAGFYCGTINVGPNVTTAKATTHQTSTVCLRRGYCAPCQADSDCPALGGRTQHCVTDSAGNGFCSPECGTTANCTYDAKCVDAGVGATVCYPRAGLCVGDGSLCSPCHSDADCGDDGLCVGGEYTTERFCAKQSAVKCANGAKQCPTSSAPNAKIGCTTSAGNLPANYCVGVYDFGTPSNGQQPTDLGCWTPAR